MAVVFPRDWIDPSQLLELGNDFFTHRTERLFWRAVIRGQVSRSGHAAPAQTLTSRASSSSLSMSSRAEAVISVAPARSSGGSRVMSDCLVSMLTGASSAVVSGGIGGRDLQQLRVAVVQDPVLWPGEPRRKPAAHRAATRTEIVDHLAPTCLELRAEVLDELG